MPHPSFYTGQRGSPKVSEQLDVRADPMGQTTGSQADAPPQRLPESRPKRPIALAHRETRHRPQR